MPVHLYTVLRALFTLLLLGVLSSGLLSAQSFNDILRRCEFGVGMEMVTLNEWAVFNGQTVPGRYHNESIQSASVSVAWNLPLLSLTEDLAIGISPAITGVLGPILSSGDPATNANADKNQARFSILLFSAPVLAMLNYGTDASFERKEHSFGAAIGAGYQGTWYTATGTVYGLPAAAAEIGYYSTSVHKLRGTVTLAPYHLTSTMKISQYNIAYYLTF